MDETLEAPLRDDEREQLLAFVDGPVPAGFADRVMIAWTEECAGTHDPHADRPPVGPDPGVVTMRRRRSMRIAVAAIVSLAAALFVAWWSRAAVVERDEARERAARLAAPEIDPPEQLTRMRTDAHALLAVHCAPCHDSMAAAPDAEALGVFDVQDPRWWIAMSDRQLRIVIDRMATSEGMSPTDIAGIESYVQAELDFRVGGPT